MKRKFTILSAAIALLVGLIIPLGMWGQTTTYTFTSKSWEAILDDGNPANWTSGKDGSQLTSGQGIQVTTSVTGANGTSPISFTDITQIVVKYCTNASKGAGTIKVQVGSGTEQSFTVTKPSSGGTTLKNATFSYNTAETGNVKVTVECTANSIYIYSVAITTVSGSSYTITPVSNNLSYGTVSLSGNVITATPAAGYQVSTTTPYTVSPANSATVVQNGNEFTVTPSANTTVTINFEAIPTHTATFSVNGTTSTQTFAEGAAITFPDNPADIGNKTFVGWVTTAIPSTTNTAPEFVDTTTATMGNDDVTFYAVFATADASGAPEETKTQTLEYDTWTYVGNNTLDQNTYRLFGDGSYVVSDAFDLSKLSKVIVYGGTYGGDSYNSLTIGDGDNIWISGTVSGKVATNPNTFTSETTLTGTKVLRVTSTCGNGSSNGIRMSKVEIFTLEPSIVYSNYCTTVSYVATPTFSPVGGTYQTAQSVTITCETSGATIRYTIDGSEPTAASTVYSTAISVTGTTTIKAIAYVGNEASEVATATYTITPYSVIFDSNGVENIVNQEGPVFSLTAPNNVPTGFTFVGWTMYETDLDVDDILEGETIDLTDYNTDNASLYAVFSGEVGAIPAIPATPARFEKVTENLEDWTGTYLIVHEGNNINSQPKAFNGSLDNLDATPNMIDVTISSGTITANDDLIAAMFTIAQNSEVENYPYTIKSASGLYIGNTTGSNGFNQSETVKYGNAIAYNSSKIVITGSGTTKLQYNQSGNNSKFRYYASDQRDIQLYKFVEGTPGAPAIAGTTQRFIRVFQDETAEDDVLILGPSIIPSGYYLDMGEKEIYSFEPDMFIIEDGGQLFSNQEEVYATVLKNIRSYNNGGGWNFVASPIFTGEGLNPSTVGMVTTQSDYDLYLFNPNAVADNQGITKEWENYKAHQNEFLLYNGHGYLYANEEDVVLQFSGLVNSPDAVVSYDYDVDSDSELKDWNLVGNPYMYEAYPNTSYYVVNGFGVEPKTNSKVAPCEGIMIQGTEGSVNFTREPEETSNPTNLQMTVAQQVVNRSGASIIVNDKAILSFNEGDQLGKFYFGTQNANLYIPQGIEEYAIVSTEAQGEMPVNFRANEDGQYTLTVNPEGIDMNYLHLIDNMTGIDVDLLQTPSYTFNATTRDYESRFRLVFAANNNNEDGPSTGSGTFAFYSNGNWIINNAGEATLQVIDVTGRVLSSETVSGSVSKTINATPGVYMLRLINGDNVNVQKIVVR